jgi:hypothetical protein
MWRDNAEARIFKAVNTHPASEWEFSHLYLCPLHKVVSWGLAVVFNLDKDRKSHPIQIAGVFSSSYAAHAHIRPQLPLRSVLSDADSGLCGRNRCPHIAGLVGGGFGEQFKLALASVPQPVGGGFKREGEGSNGDGGKSRDSRATLVKNLCDLNSDEWNKLISGAVFLLGLFGYFAYFVVTRDDRKN